MLSIQNIYYTVSGGKKLLDDISADIPSGKLTAIMGANGAGKSTLIKVISGEQKASSGNVYWNGKRMSGLSLKELAKHRSVLKQQYNLNLPFSVKQIVEMGRYPHFQSKPTTCCTAIIQEVCEYVGITHLLNRNYLTLSGGEQQRVHLARVLAQVWDAPAGKKIVMLDEPVSALDIKYQHQLLQLSKSLAEEKGFMIIAVLHDLNLAAQYADHILFLKQGQKVAFGDTAKILTEYHISNTFDIPVAIHQVANYKNSFVMIKAS